MSALNINGEFKIENRESRISTHVGKNSLYPTVITFEFGGYPTSLLSPEAKRIGVKMIFYYFISIVAEQWEHIEKRLEIIC